MTIDNQGVASYTPPRTHNTVLDAEELHGWANAMRSCANGVFEPVQQTQIRSLGAKLDAIGRTRPLRSRPPHI